MAKNLTKVSGSIFMGNPITLKVTSESEPTTSVISFHRIKMVVTINGKDYEMSCPVGSSEDVEIDISSAFRSAAEAMLYSPVTEDTTYDIFQASVQARDIWLKEGILIDPAPVNGGTPTTLVEAVCGGYSDYERSKAYQTLSFSRKPTNGELVCVGDNVVYGSSALSDGHIVPGSYVKTVTQEDGGSFTLLGRTLYVVPSAKGSMQFQFVNSRGVVESVRLWQNKAEKVKSSGQEYVVSRLERFNTFSRIINKKNAQRTEITLSSGFVSYEWAQWWIYEFGQSQQHWMKHNDMWIPCSVSLDESTTLIDETKDNMCYVQFTCKPDLNGGLF